MPHAGRQPDDERRRDGDAGGERQLLAPTQFLGPNLGIHFRQFCFAELGFDRLQVSRDAFRQGTRIAWAFFRLQFQAVLREGNQIGIRPAGIQSRHAVVQLPTRSLSEHGRAVGSDVGRLTGQNLAKDRPQAKHVGPFVQVVDFAQRLLRRHVGGRPHYASHQRLRSETSRRPWRIAADAAPQRLNDALPLLKCAGLLFVSHSACEQHFGQPPVHDLHFAERPDHDVGGFQIAMNDSARVRIGHCLADLLEDPQQPATIGRWLRTICQQLRERHAFDQLHGEERTLVGELTEFVNRSNPRMLQLATDLCFLDKPLDHFRLVLVLIQQHLDRQIPPQIGVAPLENRSHPAASDFTLYLIAAIRVPIRHLGRLRPHDGITPLLRRFPQHDACHVNGLAEGLQHAMVGVPQHHRCVCREGGRQTGIERRGSLLARHARQDRGLQLWSGHLEKTPGLLMGAQ